MAAQSDSLAWSNPIARWWVCCRSSARSTSWSGRAVRHPSRATDGGLGRMTVSDFDASCLCGIRVWLRIQIVPSSCRRAADLLVRQLASERDGRSLGGDALLTSASWCCRRLCCDDRARSRERTHFERRVGQVFRGGARADVVSASNAVAPDVIDTDMPHFTKSEDGRTAVSWGCRLSKRIGEPADVASSRRVSRFRRSPLDHRRYGPGRRRVQALSQRCARFRSADGG